MILHVAPRRESVSCSKINWGICVVFPQPVSPEMITTYKSILFKYVYNITDDQKHQNKIMKSSHFTYYVIPDSVKWHSILYLFLYKLVGFYGTLPSSNHLKSPITNKHFS
ncbi:hypothetical protein Hanom_Chr12g01091061 [Helianthus anomalus]